MDILKPPTDNLYKFVAISGVALALIAFWWPIQNGHEASTKIAALIRSASQRLGALNDLMLTTDQVKDFEALLAVGPPPSTGATPEQRAEWLVKINQREVVWRKSLLGTTAATIKATLADPVARQRYKELGLTEKQLTEPSQEMLLTAVDLARRQQKALIESMEGLQFDYADIWSLEDYALYCQLLGRRGMVIGAMLGLLGFGWWWWKVQRHQDRLLFTQANPAPISSGRIIPA